MLCEYATQVGHKPDPLLKANLPFWREQTQGFGVITVSSLLFCFVIIVLMQKVGPDLSLTAWRGRFLETTPPTKHGWLGNLSKTF